MKHSMFTDAEVKNSGPIDDETIAKFNDLEQVSDLGHFLRPRRDSLDPAANHTSDLISTGETSAVIIIQTPWQRFLNQFVQYFKVPIRKPKTISEPPSIPLISWFENARILCIAGFLMMLLLGGLTWMIINLISPI